MLHLLLLTGFVVIMACAQAYYSRRVAVYNSGIAEGAPLKKDRGIFMIIAMIIMALLVAFRSSQVGNDTPEYLRIFNEILSNSDYVSITRFEVGYVFLNRLVGKFTSNAQGVFIVCAIIQYSVFIWFIKKHSKNYALSLLLFFLLTFSSTLNIVRQALAMSFVFIAFDRILYKKPFGAIFWIIVATLFHTSAIITIILVFLPYIKFDGIFALVIFVLCVVFAFTDLLYKLCELVAPTYAHYFEGKYAESGWLAITYQLLSNLAYFAVVLIPIKVIGRNKAEVLKGRLSVNRKNNILLWITYAAFAGMLLGYKVNLIDRLITYFSAFTIVLIPNSLQKYDKTSRIVLSCAMVAILIAYSIVVIKIRPEWNAIYPYSFFWQVNA